MRIHRGIEQGSPQWEALRLGVITASCAAEIITPAKLQPSKQVDALIHRLAAERLVGQRCGDTADGPWIERGRELEAEARKWFAFNVEAVEEVGFIASDGGDFGCSPDGIAEGRFGYEAKCPSAHVHVGYLLNPESFDAYVRMQVQFGLWVTGWPLWYAHAFCPGLPSLVREVRPDPALQEALTRHVPPVVVAVAEAVGKVRALDPSMPSAEDVRAAAIAFG